MSATPHPEPPADPRTQARDPRQACWDRAIETYGTAWIFSRRAKRLAAWLRRLAFVSLVGPLTVGALATGFGLQWWGLSIALVVAAIVGVIQAIVSLWALTANWEDSLKYAYESQSDNNRLSREFQELAEAQPNDFEIRRQVLNAQYNAREQSDNNQHITEPEKREGMRAGLRQFERACSACKKVPTSMSPSQCEVCGNF